MSRPRRIARPPLKQAVAAAGGGLPAPAWARFFDDVGTNLVRVDWFDAAINPASVGANATSEQTFAVSGLATGAIVMVSKPSHTAGLAVANARVSAANTLAITFLNCTGSAIDPPQETYKVLAVRVS